MLAMSQLGYETWGQDPGKTPYQAISVPSIIHGSYMKRTHEHRLSDEALRLELEARDTISFEGGQVALREIEQQVERLGFGEAYIVSATKQPQGNTATIRLTPELSAFSS